MCVCVYGGNGGIYYAGNFCRLSTLSCSIAGFYSNSLTVNIIIPGEMAFSFYSRCLSVHMRVSRYMKLMKLTGSWSGYVELKLFMPASKYIYFNVQMSFMHDIVIVQKIASHELLGLALVCNSRGLIMVGVEPG